jgi:hypothetical protein
MLIDTPTRIFVAPKSLFEYFKAKWPNVEVGMCKLAEIFDEEDFFSEEIPTTKGREPFLIFMLICRVNVSTTLGSFF